VLQACAKTPTYRAFNRQFSVFGMAELNF